jgi:hypothetical protein
MKGIELQLIPFTRIGRFCRFAIYFVYCLCCCRPRLVRLRATLHLVSVCFGFYFLCSAVLSSLRHPFFHSF